MLLLRATARALWPLAQRHVQRKAQSLFDLEEIPQKQTVMFMIFLQNVINVEV